MSAYVLMTYCFPIFGLLIGGFVLRRLNPRPLARGGNRSVAQVPPPHNR
jgi:hypothetical protein